MRSEPAPALVRARLERLRGLYVAETAEAARTRLAAERATTSRGAITLAEAATRRLAELRALSELTSHLHRRRAR